MLHIFKTFHFIDKETETLNDSKMICPESQREKAKKIDTKAKNLFLH